MSEHDVPYSTISPPTSSTTTTSSSGPAGSSSSTGPPSSSTPNTVTPPPVGLPDVLAIVQDQVAAAIRRATMLSAATVVRAPPGPTHPPTSGSSGESAIQVSHAFLSTNIPFASMPTYIIGLYMYNCVCLYDHLIYSLRLAESL